ncbi:MAG: hypothetical protein ACQGVC_01915 [Myxococcota bacterium]
MAPTGPSLRVHLLAGLPTEAVRRGFERARESMPVVPLDAFAEVAVGNATRLGVLLPPFVEPSLVLDPDRLFAGLDACLLSEEAVDDSSHVSRDEGWALLPTPRTRLH